RSAARPSCACTTCWPTSARSPWRTSSWRSASWTASACATCASSRTSAARSRSAAWGSTWRWTSTRSSTCRKRRTASARRSTTRRRTARSATRSRTTKRTWSRPSRSAPLRPCSGLARARSWSACANPRPRSPARTRIGPKSRSVVPSENGFIPARSWPADERLGGPPAPARRGAERMRRRGLHDHEPQPPRAQAPARGAAGWQRHGVRALGLRRARVRLDRAEGGQPHRREPHERVQPGGARELHRLLPRRVGRRARPDVRLPRARRRRGGQAARERAGKRRGVGRPQDLHAPLRADPRPREVGLMARTLPVSYFVLAGALLVAGVFFALVYLGVPPFDNPGIFVLTNAIGFILLLLLGVVGGAFVGMLLAHRILANRQFTPFERAMMERLDEIRERLDALEKERLKR